MPRPNSAPAPTPPAAPSGQPQTAGRHGVGEGLRNVYFLGIKEFYSLLRDYALLFVIVFMFTGAVLADARAKPDSLSNAAIAVVDEDQSALSQRLIDALQPPYFSPPRLISRADIDRGMDMGLDTFVLNIPPNFQRDVVNGRSPSIQLNVDATRQSQALVGSTYIENILASEVLAWMSGHRSNDLPLPARLVTHVKFNPNLYASWFGGITSIINNLTVLSIVLAGAALIREREHGTIEHLLVMPVTPAEIMLGKVWSMGLVVLLAAALSLNLVVRGMLHVPIEGSIALFLCGAALHLFATTSMGIFLATVARSMPQFGMLLILVLLPLQMLSGGSTPRESMPELVQNIMLIAPTTHFVELSQAILYRGAGIDVVWKPFLALLAIGTALFTFALARFRKTISQMA